ncbi:hypothetical protein SAMN06265182_0612 [Persephonella hydrogeniphila]|uniref:Uncharacterized protein n=1 Tax=Persephonella hydrogeniphila TaxID=198703 RepID=A0A285NE93_9AQUI|nr:hypothetical protein [Persephonella hydrogeniphila]SNZ06246.1 hypothetical protein SAMN06265182_0612 [Persephonella hydrogeniphila]
MRRALTSLFLYTMFLGGIISIFYGYSLLLKKEIDIYREVLKKSDFYRIETVDNKYYLTKRINFLQEKGEIYLQIQDKKIPVYTVKSVNSVDINSEVIKKVSRNGTKGIILAAVGGISVIISLILKDFI